MSSGWQAHGGPCWRKQWSVSINMFGALQGWTSLMAINMKRRFCCLFSLQVWIWRQLPNFFLMESDASKHMVLVKSPSFLSLFACFSWRMSRGTEGKMTSSLRWLQEQLFLLLILSLIDSFFGMACTFPYGLSRPYTAMGSNAISHHAQEANLRLLQIVLIEWVALWILY